MFTSGIFNKQQKYALDIFSKKIIMIKLFARFEKYLSTYRAF